MAAQHARPRPRAARTSISQARTKALTPVGVESAMKAVLVPLARRVPGDLVCELMPGVGTSTYGDPGALAEVAVRLVDDAVARGATGEIHVRVARQFAGWSPTTVVMVTVLEDDGTGARELGHEELVLPCADEDEATSELAQARVLVVGRSDRVRRVTRRATERFGAEASEATDTTVALARLRDHAAKGSAFDAVVVDAVTVDDALTRLLERLREGGAFGAPVTLVTTSGEASVRAALDAGATVALEKPVLPRELRDAIAGARAATKSAALARAAASVTSDLGPVGEAIRARGPRASARKLRFLVVEDESLNARFAHLAIRRLGHEAVHVGSASAAVDHVTSSSFDIVLVDLDMAGLEAFQVARWMRHRERAGVRTPVLGVTAGPRDAARAAAAGIDAVLAKPVDVEELGAVLARVSPEREPR